MAIDMGCESARRLLSCTLAIACVICTNPDAHFIVTRRVESCIDCSKGVQYLHNMAMITDTTVYGKIQSGESFHITLTHITTNV